MKKLVILLGVIILLVIAVSPASAIIGGGEDFEHTNVGAIVLQDFEYQLRRLCTATLIQTDDLQSRVLLSAAHCFTGLEGGAFADQPLYISFKQDPLTENPDPTDFPDEYLAVEDYIYHSEYDPLQDDPHDIALVILEKPVSGIELEALPDRGYLKDVIGQEKGRKDIPFTIVGYGAQAGLLGDGWQYDAIRKYGTVFYKNITPYVMMTYQNEEDGVICHGDSGGPIIFDDPQLGERIVGINGIGSAWMWSCSTGGSHYRLDTASAQDWINTEIKKYK